MIQRLIVEGRRLDTHNPRRSTLGHDFGRLGVEVITDLKSTGPATQRRLEALDQLVDYRNAIGHGDEYRVRAMEEEIGIRATKRDYLKHRRSLGALAITMDETVAEGLSRTPGKGRPW